MYRVVSIVDKKGTALDRLAEGVKPYHSNFDYHVLDVHPKRPDPEQLQRFEQIARTADVIDAQYYRTIEMLRERYPWMRDIKTVLTHNNPYAIYEKDWNDYDIVIGNNKTIYNALKEQTKARVEYIPLVVEPHFWTFNEDYQYPRSVIMVANRIESKKGILPVAKACEMIGAKMTLVGAISDPAYWHEIMETGVVSFAQQVSDEQLRELYHQSGVHVCNSVDNFESGTLPILEAIFCGVPVLTRIVGHVPDIKDENNLVLNTKDPDDVDNIADLLTEMFADKKKLETMRHEAWMTIKDRNFERRAYSYQRIYRELVEGDPVTVIIPVSDKPDITTKCVNAILNQTHKNIEIIVADDGEVKQEDVVRNLRLTSHLPLRYIKIEEEGYNLAKARNLSVIEATSDILVFCDQRIVMEPDAIKSFLKELKPHHWLYGSKGVKKEFIENFSCIRRDDFVTLGMFNERCVKYGALSQECRSRARRQGFNTQYVESAKAEAIGKSNNRRRKKIEIMESKTMLWKVGLN